MPGACLDMFRVANALGGCASLEEAQIEALTEQVRAVAGAWTGIAWRTLSEAQVREHERLCADTATALRDLTRECTPGQDPSPAPGSK